MISIQDLSRNYGKTVAVQGVSTQIQRGQIVGLLGHNGAGKTTVMKILTGFLDATSGTVTVDGLDVATDRAAVQQRIGYLPENAPLYEEMLVQEYLCTMAELRGVPEANIPSAVGEAVVATGLQDRLLDPIHTLSKGLRQRVGIAQAIVHKPAVLVLDEPTNGLDPMQIQAIRTLIKRLGASTTIILSTHILQEIEAVCDRVLIMIQGRLVADKPLRELVHSDRVRFTVPEGTADVAKVVGGVDGIIAVSAAGGTAGFDAYTARYSSSAPPVPEIIAAATKAGWRLGAVAPEVRTLETVFKELQAADVAARAQAGGDA